MSRECFAPRPSSPAPGWGHGVVAGIASCGDVSGTVLRADLVRTRAVGLRARQRWLDGVRAGQYGYLAVVVVLGVTVGALAVADVPGWWVTAGAVALSVVALTPLACQLWLWRHTRSSAAPQPGGSVAGTPRG